MKCTVNFNGSSKIERTMIMKKRSVSCGFMLDIKCKVYEIIEV